MVTTTTYQVHLFLYCRELLHWGLLT